jgi:hypothetical protein
VVAVAISTIGRTWTAVLGAEVAVLVVGTFTVAAIAGTLTTILGTVLAGFIAGATIVATHRRTLGAVGRADQAVLLAVTPPVAAFGRTFTAILRTCPATLPIIAYLVAAGPVELNRGSAATTRTQQDSDKCREHDPESRSTHILTSHLAETPVTIPQHRDVN